MNKRKFIDTLSKKLNYEKEKCTLINAIIEDTFILGKNNKDIMINKFMTNLNVSIDKANEIYDVVMSILSKEIKYKINHPFKNRD